MSNSPRIPAALSLDGLPTDARSAFDLAAASGYSGIALPTNHPELRPQDLGPTARRHLQSTLNSRHLNIQAIRVAAPRGGLADPATIDRTMNQAKAAIQLAYDLNVHTVTLHTGPLAATLQASSSSSSPLNPDTIRQAMQLLAAEADRANIHLGFSSDNTEKLTALLQQINSPNALANFSPANSLAANEDPLLTASRLAGLIASLTAADAIKAGQQLRPTDLGQGQIPWPELLAQLNTQNFQGPLIVDLRDLPHPEQSAQQAAHLLSQLLLKKV